MQIKFKKIFLSLVGISFSLNSIGCFMSTGRPADVVQPGEYSIGARHVKISPDDSEENNGEMGTPSNLSYIGIEGRFGILRGLDAGYTYGLDQEMDFNTHWFDLKYQILNKDQFDDRFSLSFGYGFGRPNMSDIDNGLFQESSDEMGMWFNRIYFTGSKKINNFNPFINLTLTSSSEDIMVAPLWLWKEDDEKFSPIERQLTIGVEFKSTEMLYPVIEFGKIWNDEVSIADGNNIFTLGLNLYYNR